MLLTDGRANVSLAKSNEDPDAIAEGAPRPSQARHPRARPRRAAPLGLRSAARRAAVRASACGFACASY